MKIYLLFLLAILVTCRANEGQLNAYPKLQLRNDLNGGEYLYGEGGYVDRNVGRSAYVERAGLGQAVNVGRTSGLNDYSYVRRKIDLSQIKSIGSATTAIGKLPIVANPNPNDNLDKEVDVDKSQNPASLRITDNLYGEDRNYESAARLRRNSNFGQEPNHLNEIGRVGHQGNNLNDADNQAYKIVRSKISPPAPLLRTGTKFTGLDGLSLGKYAKKTYYLDKSNSVVREGSNDQKDYIKNLNGLNLSAGVDGSNPNHEINISHRFGKITEPTQRPCTQANTEIEVNQQNPQVPSSLIDINLKDRAARGKPDKSEPADLVNVANRLAKDGYAPYDNNAVPKDVINHPIDSVGASNSEYVGIDLQMLAPEFDKLSESHIKSLLNNKVTGHTLSASYNNNNSRSITENTNSNAEGKSDVADRFQNIGFVFPSAIEEDQTISYGSKCYCSIKNGGHRTCSCNYDHSCEGGNCQRVTEKPTTPHEYHVATEFTTPKRIEMIPKWIEITTSNPIVCAPCTKKSQHRLKPNINHCERCKHNEHSESSGEGGCRGRGGCDCQCGSWCRHSCHCEHNCGCSNSCSCHCDCCKQNQQHKCNCDSSTENSEHNEKYEVDDDNDKDESEERDELTNEGFDSEVLPITHGWGGDGVIGGDKEFEFNAQTGLSSSAGAHSSNIYIKPLGDSNSLLGMAGEKPSSGSLSSSSDSGTITNSYGYKYRGSSAYKAFLDKLFGKASHYTKHFIDTHSASIFGKSREEY